MPFRSLPPETANRRAISCNVLNNRIGANYLWRIAFAIIAVIRICNFYVITTRYVRIITISWIVGTKHTENTGKWGKETHWCRCWNGKTNRGLWNFLTDLVARDTPSLPPLSPRTPQTQALQPIIGCVFSMSGGQGARRIGGSPSHSPASGRGRAPHPSPAALRLLGCSRLTDRIFLKTPVFAL